jgi:hypothetical protein
MLEEVIVIVDDEPGTLAGIGELLGRSGVNIETLCASSHDGRGVIHLVVDDGEDASEVLQANGYKVEQTRAVLTTTIDDRPGELGRYCRKLASAGVAISSAYVAKRADGESELIMAVDDIEAARGA